MDLPKSRLTYLLSSHHNKTITAKESEELARLINQASDDELAAFLLEEWEKPSTQGAVFNPSRSHKMLNKILEAEHKTPGIVPIHKKRKFFTFQKFAAAVAILIIAGVGIYFGLQNVSHEPQTIAEHQVVTDALPGGNKAILTLSSGKTIVLDTAQNGVLAVQGSIRVNKTKDGQLIYKVTGNTTNKSISYNTLSTPRGGQYQIVLPDGSKVWLNAASSLKFPDIFKEKERVVELTGEAYFEIAKNPDMPFKVKSGATEVEVLGTHFNVMAYEDEKVMKTTLLEGAIKIKSDGESNILKPGEQAIVDKDGSMKVLDQVNVNEAVAWKNGLFHFNDTDLPTIMRQAARWYDLEVHYEGEIPQRHFTGKISRNVKASELLSILEYTGVKFRIEEKAIIVTN